MKHYLTHFRERFTAMATSFFQPNLESQLVAFDAKQKFDRLLEQRAEVFEARWLWGQRLRDATCDSGKYSGWCGLCHAPTEFSYASGGPGPVNLREELHCANCELNARNRVALTLARELVPDQNAKIYATEQASPAFRWIRGHYRDPVGSEYFDDSSEQRLRNYLHSLFEEEVTLRHEDATSLTFPDHSLDLVLSSDVLEHIPDFRAALAEFSRVLKSGGHLVLTVPFDSGSARSLLRAEVNSDGNITHHVEPEYHGDPVSPDGVLAFHTFGWDLLESATESGFKKAHWCFPWNPAQAIFSGLWVLHAQR